MPSRFFSAVLGAAFASGCDNVRLSLEPVVEPPVVVQSAGQVCAGNPETIEAATKILFLVDKSGSNRTGNPPSDPTGAFRFDTINDFFQATRTDLSGGANDVYWGLVVFAERNAQANARALINAGDNQSPTFTNDGAAFEAALAEMRAEQDDGGTPYQAANQMALRAILNDRNLPAWNPNTKYVVIMISDGVPTDYGTPVNEQAIDNDVRNVVMSGNGSTYHTVFYNAGQENPAAETRLQRMALVGRGLYFNRRLQPANEVRLAEFIRIGTRDTWAIRQFMVFNLTSAACDDGTVGADSDADGLCDVDEVRYNDELLNDPWVTASARARLGGKSFDPRNRNSFDPNFNDQFFLRLLIYGETIPSTCPPDKLIDSDGDFLNGCEEELIANASPAGRTAKWEEKMGGNSDRHNFDSDGDGVMDWLEFSWFRSKSAVLDFTSIGDLFEGFRADQVVLQHRNYRRPEATVPYDGVFRFDRVKRGQNCYTYQQSTLPLYPVAAVSSYSAGSRDLTHQAGENLVLIYFIQVREADANGAGQLKYTIQRIRAEDKTLRLDLAHEGYQTVNPIEALVSQ